MKEILPPTDSKNAQSGNGDLSESQLYTDEQLAQMATNAARHYEQVVKPHLEEVRRAQNPPPEFWYDTDE